MIYGPGLTMAITTTKKSAKDKAKTKEQDIFVWQGVNRKGKKLTESSLLKVLLS